MWSVLRERVDVKIDKGVVRVRRRGHADLTLEHPNSLPMSDVLARVDAACARSEGKPWRVHVSLGQALCTVSPFSLPGGVKRWQEILAVAHATAAQIWGLPLDQAHELDCIVDLRRKSEVAALLVGTHQQIRAWAEQDKGRLASLVPDHDGQPCADLQFVPSPARKIAWTITGAFLLCLAVFTGVQVWQQHRFRSELRVELDRLQADLKARSEPDAAKVNPREASEKAALRFMQRDWNRLYDTIESNDLAAVKLLQLSLDGETGEARLEYELDHMGQGADITTALNRNAPPGTWRLENMAAAGALSASGPAGGTRFRGVWRAMLE